MTNPTYLPDHPHPLRVDDVLDALRRQHDETRTALDGLRHEFGGARITSLHALKLQLACHETAEQRVVHPVVAALDGKAQAGARIEEEGQAAELLGRLERLDVDSVGFDTTFAEFAEDVRAHAAAEERNEWPVIEQVGNPDVLTQMFGMVEAVPELARSIEVPALAATYEQMLGWAGEQFDERFPTGVEVGRLTVKPPTQEPSSGPADPVETGRRKRRSMMLLAGALLAVGGYVVGRRRHDRPIQAHSPAGRGRTDKSGRRRGNS